MSGFLQVLSSEPLDSLEQFCNQSLDVRSVDNAGIQQKMAEESYLPVDVASIIIKLIEIRKNTFLNAAVRTEDDYVDWEDPDMEHPTQFYPNWKIWRYPKKYVVRNVSDCESVKNPLTNTQTFLTVCFLLGVLALSISHTGTSLCCVRSPHIICSGC